MLKYFSKHPERLVITVLILAAMCVSLAVVLSSRPSSKRVAHTPPVSGTPATYTGCVSAQMNRLDECDSDTTPDYGEDWIGYINSQ